MRVAVNIIIAMSFFATAIYVDYSAARDYALVVFSMLTYIFLVGSVLKDLKPVFWVNEKLRRIFVMFVPVIIVNLMVWVDSGFSVLQCKANVLAFLLLALFYFSLTNMLRFEPSNPFENMFDMNNQSKVNVDEMVFGRYTKLLQSGFILVVIVVGLSNLLFAPS